MELDLPKGMSILRCVVGIEVPDMVGGKNAEGLRTFCRIQYL